MKPDPKSLADDAAGQDRTLAGMPPPMTPSRTTSRPAPNGAEALAQAGGRICQARHSRGLSIKDLAFAAGISPSFLCYIETGRKAPSLATLTRLAQALGIALPRILRAAGRKPGSGQRCFGAFLRIVSWSSSKERALFHRILSSYAKSARSKTGAQRERLLKGVYARLGV